MLALKTYEQKSGFSVLTTDELYYINGGSCKFGAGYYNNGNGHGYNVYVEFDGKDGNKHGGELHVGIDNQGHVDVGGSFY